MKLWEKGINPEPAIIEFTAGKDRKTDLALTKWDIIGSMAHVIMLDDVGLISKDDKNGLLKAFIPSSYGTKRELFLLRRMLKIFTPRLKRRWRRSLAQQEKKFIPGGHEMIRFWLIFVYIPERK